MSQGEVTVEVRSWNAKYDQEPIPDCEDCVLRSGKIDSPFEQQLVEKGTDEGWASDQSGSDTNHSGWTGDEEEWTPEQKTPCLEEHAAGKSMPGIIFTNEFGQEITEATEGTGQEIYTEEEGNTSKWYLTGQGDVDGSGSEYETAEEWGDAPGQNSGWISADDELESVENKEPISDQNITSSNLNQKAFVDGSDSNFLEQSTIPVESFIDQTFIASWDRLAITESTTPNMPAVLGHHSPTNYAFSRGDTHSTMQNENPDNLISNVSESILCSDTFCKSECATSKHSQDSIASEINYNIFTNKTNQNPITSETNQDPFVSKTDQDSFSSETGQDPFSSETNQDLFTSRPNWDLFARETAQDPFYNESDQDFFATETNQDPFSSETDQDPFVTKTYQDPFASETCQDAFASETYQDLFGSETVQDSFDNETCQDPFASETNQDFLSSKTVLDHFDNETYQNSFTCEIYQNFFASEIVQDPFAMETNQDPFASETVQDPFTNVTNQNHFISKSSLDHIANETNHDLFTNKTNQDPFTSETNQDPFDSKIDMDPFASETNWDSIAKKTNWDQFASKNNQDHFTSEINQDSFAKEDCKKQDRFSSETNQNTCPSEISQNMFVTDTNQDYFVTETDRDLFASDTNQVSIIRETTQAPLTSESSQGWAGGWESTVTRQACGDEMDFSTRNGFAQWAAFPFLTSDLDSFSKDSLQELDVSGGFFLSDGQGEIIAGWPGDSGPHKDSIFACPAQNNTPSPKISGMEKTFSIKEPENSDLSEDEVANRRYGKMYQEIDAETDEVPELIPILV